MLFKILLLWINQINKTKRAVSKIRVGLFFCPQGNGLATNARFFFTAENGECRVYAEVFDTKAFLYFRNENFPLWGTEGAHEFTNWLPRRRERMETSQSPRFLIPYFYFLIIYFYYLMRKCFFHLPKSHFYIGYFTFNILHSPLFPKKICRRNLFP